MVGQAIGADATNAIAHGDRDLRACLRVSDRVVTGHIEDLQVGCLRLLCADQQAGRAAHGQGDGSRQAGKQEAAPCHAHICCIVYAHAMHSRSDRGRTRVLIQITGNVLT